MSTTAMMVDIETMGNGNDAAIVSIGAVMFDPVGTAIGAEFYKVVDLVSSLSWGLKVDADTIYWWLQQSEAARAAICSPDKTHLCTVLSSLTAFWGINGGEAIWCQGGNFDEPILKQAYRNLHQQTPWPFWSLRDTRTHYAAAGFVPEKSARDGTYHNALDDARTQVRWVQEASRRLAARERAFNAYNLQTFEGADQQ